MKKIIYISIVDITQKNGQGIYALKVLESLLKKSEITIDVIVPYFSDPKISNKIKKKNIRLHYLLEKKNIRNVLWHFQVQIQLLIHLFKLGRKDKLIYSVKPSMFAPILYYKIFRTPIYLLVEGLAKKSINKVIPKPFRGIGLRILEKNIDIAHSVYPAYQSAKLWVDSIRKNTSSEIIHCGVDPNIFKPVSNDNSNDNSNDILAIGYVGSFRKEHMIFPLIQAIEDLDVKLYLVGDGKERNQIIDYIEGKNLSKSVIYLGTKEHEELPKFFSECDILASMTDINHWGVPIKGFEYLSCNKKILFTYKKDLEFVISNNYGYVLRSNEIKEIRNVIIHIIEDKKLGFLKDNLSSSKYIYDNNNWDIFANKLI